MQTGVVKTGGFRYDDGTRYIGDWNQRGQKHGNVFLSIGKFHRKSLLSFSPFLGMGHLLLPDGTRYGREFNFVIFHQCVYDQ